MTDADGVPVRVSARCAVSAPPVQITVPGRTPEQVTAWTGPWPVTERWWDPDSTRRRARFQVVTGEGHAYLLTLEGGQWHTEATYD